MQCHRWLVSLVALLLLASCGGGGTHDSGAGLGPSGQRARLSGMENVVPLVVDSELATSGVNRLYTSVTLCKPGSTQCQTIDHVLVDTGSVGLRLLATAVSSRLQLSKAKNDQGNVLLSCAKFLDQSYAWGPMALADVKLGALVAANTPIQLVGDANYDAFSTQCPSEGMTNGAYDGWQSIVTQADLGANGILGIGLAKQDCGVPCEPLPPDGAPILKRYFACRDRTCTGVNVTALPAKQHLQQVVSRFPTDNNGFAIRMDAVPDAGAATATGKLIFGLGTRDNNQFVTHQLIPTDIDGLLSGTISSALPPKGAFLYTFFDTGSNGIYFDWDLSFCRGSIFYCPISDVAFTVRLLGNAGPSLLANFTIGNAASMFQQGFAALPTLGGAINLESALDLGLPFFYGRTVLIGIDGQEATGVGPGGGKVVGPFYAL